MASQNDVPIKREHTENNISITANSSVPFPALNSKDIIIYSHLGKVSDTITSLSTTKARPDEHQARQEEGDEKTMHSIRLKRRCRKGWLAQCLPCVCVRASCLVPPSRQFLPNESVQCHFNGRRCQPILRTSRLPRKKTDTKPKGRCF